MSNAHTPGPWRVAFDMTVTASAAGVVEGSKHIADCGNTLRKDSENIANARLIAAAPELLAALEGAEEWLSGWASADPYLTVIRAAIAKAKGE